VSSTLLELLLHFKHVVLCSFSLHQLRCGKPELNEILRWFVELFSHSLAVGHLAYTFVWSHMTAPMGYRCHPTMDNVVDRGSMTGSVE